MLFNKNTINQNNNILNQINKRRRQILVHSYLYYKKDTNLIDDFTFDTWCRELVNLHAKYPKQAKEAVFQKAFKNWTGCSGYDLFNDTTTESWASCKALQLQEYIL